jgi:hypothetical protein
MKHVCQGLLEKYVKVYGSGIRKVSIIGELKKTTKNVGNNNRIPWQDSKPGASEYEAEVLTTTPSVISNMYSVM